MIDFQKLLEALAGSGVRFVIVGGVAATIHGSARLTSDIDVVYDRADDNLRRIVRALAPLEPYLRGAPTGLPFRFDEKTLLAGLNFTLTTSAGPIDLLGEITGIGGYAGLDGKTVDVTLFGKTYRCIDLDALIHAKRAAGRPKDLEIIAELEAIRESRG